MKLPRRRFLHLAAGAAALPAVSRIARAQAYPTRPVRVIVPFAPAGGSDITARLIGQWLSERVRPDHPTHRRGVLRYRVHTHDAANDDAIGEHVEVIVLRSPEGREADERLRTNVTRSKATAVLRGRHGT
jgi:hypothetical protein